MENSALLAADKISDESDKSLFADDNVKLLGSTQTGPCRKYWYRWYICLLFAMLGMFQGAIWNTWSPIDDSAKVAIGFTASDITLLTNWGPIAFLICMPVFTWMMDHKGLRITVLTGAFFVAIGTGLRCLPLKNHILKYFIHVGQFLNGISGCPVMAIPPMLSNIWFPPEERITATGIATLLNYFGTGLGFIIGPLFVQEPSNNTQNMSCILLNKDTNGSCAEIHLIRHQIENMMYFEFAVSSAIFIAMLIFFPDKPPTPPSISASTERLNLKEGLLKLRYNGRYWVIALVGGLMMGTWGGWSGVMPILLRPLNILQDESDSMGFVTTLIGCIIGIIIGWFTDRIKGKMKLMLLILTAITLITFCYFVIIANQWLHFHPFLPGLAEMWTVMVILGISTNASIPLIMEMSADSAYPVGEATSSSIVVWLMNLLSFVFLIGLSVAPDPVFANYILLGCIALSVPMIAFGTKEVNQRLQMDTDTNKNVRNRSESSYGSVDNNSIDAIHSQVNTKSTLNNNSGNFA